MVIDAAASLDRRYCSQCKKWRSVPEAADAWSYCERCGTILVRPEMRRRYAGFWRRAGGYAIDYAVLIGLEIICIVLIPGEDASGVLAATLLLAAIAAFIAALAYVVVGNARGATLGKAAMGLRIVDAHGNPPGLKRSLGRYLMSIISGVLLIGYLAMIWDRQKQTWHDHAANTYVIKR